MDQLRRMVVNISITVMYLLTKIFVLSFLGWLTVVLIRGFTIVALYSIARSLKFVAGQSQRYIFQLVLY
jgi:hypothetical protein